MNVQKMACAQPDRKALAKIAAEEMSLCGICGVSSDRVIDELGTDWGPSAFQRQVTAWCDELKLSRSGNG